MASSVDSRPPLLQTSCAKIVEATVRKSASNLKRDECSCVESRLSFERKKQLRQWLGEKIVEYENSLGKVGGEGTLTLINEQEYSTVIKRIYCPSDEQYKTLKAFHGHLVANFFSTIKVSSFKGNKFSSLVIYPAPALVHFYYAVSPAFLVVQDLTQCGESKATMVMKALEVTMENFHCGFDVLASRLISKTQRVLQEVPTSEKTFLWETRMSLMIHDNDAILTSINKVEDCTLYQALLAYRLPVQRASSSPRIEPKAKLSPTKANQVQEMQFEILYLRETVRSLEDKLDESESKLREKDSTSTKNTETQTSNKDEEKIQIKALNERVLSLKDELKKSQQKCSEVEGSFKKMEAYHKQELVRLTKKNKDVENKANALEEKLESMKEYLNEILNDYGCALVERDKLARETTSDKTANPRTTNLCSTSCQTCQMPSLQATNLTHSEETRGAEAITNNVEQASLTNVTSERDAERNLSVTTIQQSREETNEQEKISLSNIPATVVERSLYNNYKMLLLTIARLLLSGEVAQFKAWVFSKFSVDAMSLNVDEIFLELDRKEVISAFDLRKLREFFEGILKIEVVHMIDSFLVGDYLPLRSASHCDVSKKNILTSNGNPSAVASHIGTFGSGNGCRGTSQSTVADFRPSSFVGKPGCFEVEESCVVRRDSSRETPLLPGNHRSKKATEEKATTRQAVQTFLVTNGSSRGSEGQVSNPAAALTRPRSQVDFGSNGKKLSKFQRPDSPGRRSTSARGSADDHNDDDLDDDSQWLCNHYKRRCYVKFGCCNKYWPCHRCHNNESKCGETKLKSRDTKFVKCVKCGTKQPFGANSQYCSNCHLKFAKYFCEICKHLTGTDDNPYHCEKCGICRIHGDRSFHCDVCGVCLDVQLRGNHKCRAGSAHDECCICLEDAFTGCQILPCSHKVHKECATQMIRSGITRCPICRESFAHKLERRNLPPSRKNK